MAEQKHLGYTNWYELYLMQDEYTTADWTRIILSISQYIGFLRSWMTMVHIDNGTVVYYIGTNKDIGTLSNKLEGVVLRPVDKAKITAPVRAAKERMVQFVAGGNVLDIKEKYEVKRGKSLEWIAFSIRTINVEKAICDVQFCFKDAAGSYSVARKHTFVLPSQLLAINFLHNNKYLRKKTAALS